MLHFIYSHPNLAQIRGSPAKVAAAIDEFGRTKKYLMNVGEDKGGIVTDLITKERPTTMVELGGYIGYSAVIFGEAFRKAGGATYYSLEQSPEFAAVAMALIDLAGLSDVVKIVIGSSADSIRRLCDLGTLKKLDLLFIDHYKPAYTTDLRLCEHLGIVGPGSTVVADNVLFPGNPQYLEYVRKSVEEKRGDFEKEGDVGAVDERIDVRFKNQYGERGGERFSSATKGNPNLRYESTLVRSFEPNGTPVSRQEQFYFLPAL